MELSQSDESIVSSEPDPTVASPKTPNEDLERQQCLNTYERKYFRRMYVGLVVVVSIAIGISVYVVVN